MTNDDTAPLVKSFNAAAAYISVAEKIFGITQSTIIAGSGQSEENAFGEKN